MPRLPARFGYVLIAGGALLIVIGLLVVLLRKR